MKQFLHCSRMNLRQQVQLRGVIDILDETVCTLVGINNDQ